MPDAVTNIAFHAVESIRNNCDVSQSRQQEVLTASEVKTEFDVTEFFLEI
jgi:hypothetical protein